jgi:hypothetical protein
MRLIFILISLFSVFMLGSCAHKKKCCGGEAKPASSVQAFEFENTCPMGLCRKGQRVKCNPEITLAHKGKNYCFSSLEARSEFMKDVNGNIKKAAERWKMMPSASPR